MLNFLCFGKKWRCRKRQKDYCMVEQVLGRDKAFLELCRYKVFYVAIEVGHNRGFFLLCRDNVQLCRVRVSKTMSRHNIFMS